MNGHTQGGAGLREWCRAHGVAPATLHRALVAGRVARLASGGLDVASADAWLHERRTPARQPQRSGGPRRGTVAHAQCKLTEYKARLARLEYLRRRGELLDANEVKSAVFSAVRKSRDNLLGIASRVGPILSGLTDSAECHKVVYDECKRVVTELAEDARRACGGEVAS